MCFFDMFLRTSMLEDQRTSRIQGKILINRTLTTTCRQSSRSSKKKKSGDRSFRPSDGNLGLGLFAWHIGNDQHDDDDPITFRQWQPMHAQCQTCKEAMRPESGTDFSICSTESLGPLRAMQSHSESRREPNSEA